MINDPRYGGDSLPSCVQCMALSCGPLVAWMEKLSVLGGKFMAKYPLLHPAAYDYQFTRQDISTKFSRDVTEPIIHYSCGVPSCHTRKLQMEEHTKFVFEFLGVDLETSPIYQDFRRLQYHGANIITYATSYNRILLNFPPTSDSREQHVYNIDRILSSAPEYAASMLLDASSESPASQTASSPHPMPEEEELDEEPPHFPVEESIEGGSFCFS